MVPRSRCCLCFWLDTPLALLTDAGRNRGGECLPEDREPVDAAGRDAASESPSSAFDCIPTLDLPAVPDEQGGQLLNYLANTHGKSVSPGCSAGAQHPGDPT
jgi:hypothetical protein